MARRQYLKQSVNLTAFGSPLFHNYITKIEEIHELFIRHLSADAMFPQSPDDFESHEVIAIGNWFYTDRHDKGGDVDIPFSYYVDPQGILECGKGAEFVHLTENKVDYFEMKGSSLQPE